MKDLEFLGVGLRLMGTACIIFVIGKSAEGVNAINQFSQIDMGQSSIAFKVSIWLPIALVLLIGAVFVKFPISVAKMLLPRTTEKGHEIELGQNSILVSGLILVGVYLLSYSLPDLGYNIILLYQQYNLGLYENPLISETIVYLVSTLTEIALGLYLILGATGLVKVIHKLRR